MLKIFPFNFTKKRSESYCYLFMFKLSCYLHSNFFFVALKFAYRFSIEVGNKRKKKKVVKKEDIVFFFLFDVKIKIYVVHSIQDLSDICLVSVKRTDNFKKVDRPWIHKAVFEIWFPKFFRIFWSFQNFVSELVSYFPKFPNFFSSVYFTNFSKCNFRIFSVFSVLLEILFLKFFSKLFEVYFPNFYFRIFQSIFFWTFRSIRKFIYEFFPCFTKSYFRIFWSFFFHRFFLLN